MIEITQPARHRIDKLLEDNPGQELRLFLRGHG